MKKLSPFFIIAIFTLVIVPQAVAANQDRTRDPNTHDLNIVQNLPVSTNVGTQNQVQTQNSGEDQNLIVSTQQQDAQNNNSGNGGTNRSEVAQAVQQLLDTPDRKGGLGDQVRVIAQQQNQTQEQINQNLLKIQNRSRFTRMLIGPNYGAVESLEAQIQQNQQYIEELENLTSESLYPAETENIQANIDALTDQNELLTQEITDHTQGFSLFGWFQRLLLK